MPTAGRSRSSLTWVSAASICITWVATSRNGSKRSGARCCRTFTDVDPTAIVAGIVGELMALRKPDRAAAEKRYLKSDLVFLGVGVPGIRTTAKHAHHDHPALTSVLAVVTELWAEPLHERRMAALEILGLYRDRLQPPDIGLIERLIRESKTWAYVDSFAVAIAGPLVERFQDLHHVLDRWSTDPDFWIRRSALLALLPSVKRGGDFNRFARYAEPMLTEREFFIRKAIGWVLREVSKSRPQVVYDWLRPRIGLASGVTVREAVRYLPALQRDQLLSAYRAGRAGRVTS